MLRNENFNFTIDQNQSKFKAIYVGFFSKKYVDLHLLHQVENVFLLRCKCFVDTIADL